MFGIRDAWTEFVWFSQTKQILATAAEIHSTNFTAGKSMMMSSPIHFIANNFLFFRQFNLTVVR